jgi:hypothetical protein
MATDERALEALLDESREFEPTERFRSEANVSDPAIYERAAAEPEAFWAEWARRLDWFDEWDEVLDWTPPHAKWFVWTGTWAARPGTRLRWSGKGSPETSGPIRTGTFTGRWASSPTSSRTWGSDGATGWRSIFP